MEKKTTYRQPNSMQKQRHHRSITQMTSNLIRHIHILHPRDPLDRSQPSNGIPRRRRPKQVPQHPVVPGKSIDEPTSNDAPDLEPGLLVGRDGTAKDVDVLDDAVRFAAGEFGEGVEDCSGAEGETD